MAAGLHLDTNILIFGLDPTHSVRERIGEWSRSGGGIAVCAMAWSEFLCGPVGRQSVEAWLRVLNGRVLPVDRAAAERAADLFNRTGRRSRSLPDCLIAASAMAHGAALATLNRQDFEPFLAHGLMLA
jgi:Predicted nucleic acid-binding protein, contains PIN domain